jgi:hypothetical protein
LSDLSTQSEICGSSSPPSEEPPAMMSSAWSAAGGRGYTSRTNEPETV